MSSATDLIAYAVVGNPPPIRPAPARRAWMDSSTHRHAYLCLPLVAANVAGWELLCPVAFTATWDGGSEPDAVHVDSASRSEWTPVGHFGHGVLTLHTGYIFRTSTRHDLWVKGPTNEGKDGLAPLEVLIETDWLPYPFTMNYRFTRASQSVSFDAGEPFCLVHPMPRDYLTAIEPVVRSLADEAALERQHRAWVAARRAWNAEREVTGSAAARERWRKDYLRGQTAIGDRAAEHKAATSLRAFDDRRSLR